MMALWYFLLSFAVAQVPARTIEVQLQDPRGQVKSGLQASVRGSSGTQLQVRFRNDGQPPDLEALDTIHTTAFPLADASMALTLTSGGETWEVETAIDQDSTNPVITLHLGPNGGLVVVQGEGASPKDTPSTTAAASGGSGWIWGGLFVGLGLGLGLGLRWIGRRTVVPAPLVGTPQAPQIPPRCVPRGALDATVSGALAEHRIIVLGQAGDCAGAYACCAEPVTSPAELVAAVEQVAVTPGEPVALLIVDAARLLQDGRIEPLEDLNQRVGGRFPLWVVDGPQDWA